MSMVDLVHETCSPVPSDTLDDYISWSDNRVRSVPSVPDYDWMGRNMISTVWDDWWHEQSVYGKYRESQIKIRWEGGKRPEKHQTLTEEKSLAPGKFGTLSKRVTDFASSIGVAPEEVAIRGGYYIRMVAKRLETDEELLARQAKWDRAKARFEKRKARVAEANKAETAKAAQAVIEQREREEKQIRKDAAQDEFIVVKLTPAQYKKLQAL